MTSFLALFLAAAVSLLGPQSKQEGQSLPDLEGYTLAGLAMTDASPLNSEALRDGVFSIKDGELYDPKTIEDGLKRIKRLYEDLGYIDFAYTHKIDVNQSEKSVSCSFHLVPGKQYFINHFNVSGAKSNEETAAIGSEISDFEGKIFSPTTFYVLRKRLNDYLENKELSLKDLQYERLSGSPGKVDITVLLQTGKL